MPVRSVEARVVRSPLGATFDGNLYLALNADVSGFTDEPLDTAGKYSRDFDLSGDRVAPDTNLFGDSALQAENRLQTDPLAVLTDQLFDQQSYLNLYHDLRSVTRNNPDYDLKEHFLKHGSREGRVPSAFFDLPYTTQRLTKFDEIKISAAESFCYFATLPFGRRFVPNRIFSPWAFRRLYLERYPEIEKLSDYALFEFYLNHYVDAALSPNGVFSEEDYRLRYPDIAEAIGEGRHPSGLLHFIVNGAGEGRLNLPGVLGTHIGSELDWMLGGQEGLEPIVWWFDEAFYLSVYTDVHELVRRTIVKSGLEHFLVVGFREGRLPSPHLFRHMPSNADFCPRKYFRDLTDRGPIEPVLISIEEACAILTSLEASGGTGSRYDTIEALWPHVARPRLGGTFDANLYVAVNVDVARSIDGSLEEKHWRDFGLDEHRVAPSTNLFSDRAVTFQDMLDWKSGVNFFGPINATSGLGSAARGYAAALRQAGVPIDIYDTSWLSDPKLPVDLFCAADLNYSINFMCLNADQVVAFALKVRYRNIQSARQCWRLGLGTHVPTTGMADNTVGIRPHRDAKSLLYRSVLAIYRYTRPNGPLRCRRRGSGDSARSRWRELLEHPDSSRKNGRSENRSVYNGRFIIFDAKGRRCVL